MLERTRQRDYLRKVRLVIGMHPDPSVGRQGTSKLRLHANHRFEITKMADETFNLLTTLKFWCHPQKSLKLVSQLALLAEDRTSVSIHISPCHIHISPCHKAHVALAFSFDSFTSTCCYFPHSCLVLWPMLLKTWMSPVSVIVLFLQRGRRNTPRLVSPLQPIWHGWPYQEPKSRWNISRGSLKRIHKPSHHINVVTPKEGFQFKALWKYNNTL